MLSESVSNKSLSLSERIDVLNRWIERKLIRQSRGTMAFIIWQNNTNPDRKRKRTHKAEDVEEALLRFFPMPGMASCQSSLGLWDKDIFNADETGLYSRAIHEGTLSFKNSETAACKTPTERATLLFDETSTGTKANDYPTLPPVTFVDFLQSLKRIQSNLDACYCDDYGVFY
ncbi:hypothetical protein RF11_03902 [Thelohanellus kitauei]|uniref:DDE-1 domain-containing protein n=1 Tax=Thelohanellus kitauei TaxID=669202 RepID=A0A0C2IGP8_THEKT|nr:hypothetical protein RF11_03902 [Thelohanellus kitauei]